MAGDWIAMRVDLTDDPAVIAIATTLGLDEYGVVGRLHRLWSWADAQLVDGNAHSVTVSWVDRYLGTSGFASALLSAGWLEAKSDGQTGGICFPKFGRWNTKSAKQRLLTARRVAKHKAGKGNAPANGQGNAGSVTNALPTGQNSIKPPYPRNGGMDGGANGKAKIERSGPTDINGCLLFRRFWDAYPRKEKRPAAVKAFSRLGATEEVLNQMLAAMERQRRAGGCLDNRKTPDGRSTIPHPSSWLNQRRWEDEDPLADHPTLSARRPVPSNLLNAEPAPTLEELQIAGGER